VWLGDALFVVRLYNTWADLKTDMDADSLSGPLPNGEHYKLSPSQINYYLDGEYKLIMFTTTYFDGQHYPIYCRQRKTPREKEVLLVCRRVDGVLQWTLTMAGVPWNEEFADKPVWVARVVDQPKKPTPNPVTLACCTWEVKVCERRERIVCPWYKSFFIVLSLENLFV